MSQDEKLMLTVVASFVLAVCSYALGQDSQPRTFQTSHGTVYAEVMHRSHSVAYGVSGGGEMVLHQTDAGLMASFRMSTRYGTISYDSAPTADEVRIYNTAFSDNCM